MPDRLPRYQRIIIELSLSILRDAMARGGTDRADTIPVRLALRCLMPHCQERWPLDSYWSASGQDNDIGRSQGLTAAFNGICRQLRLANRYPEL